jgi:hypothetical protein
MGKIDPVDAIGWSSILLWIVLSVCFAWSGNSSAFQAVGVVGIAGDVGYFAMQHHATPHAIGSLEIENILSARIFLASDAGARALAYVSILAKEIVSSSNSRGETVHPTLVALSQVTDAHNLHVLSQDPEANFEREKAILVERMAANKVVEKGRRNSEVLQAFVVVVATLQSGLGGYLVELLGKRAVQC